MVNGKAGEPPITNFAVYHAAFLVIALVFFGLQLYHFWLEGHPEWLAIQKRYVELARRIEAQPPYPRKLVDFRYGPRELSADRLAIRDRCMTCHLGIDDPDFASAPGVLAAHPGRYLDAHPPEKFGCTGCHGGDGTGLTYEAAAHGAKSHFHDSMVAAPLIEARCGSCHRTVDVPGAANLTRGRRRIRDAMCSGCHALAPPEDAPVARLSLAGVGRKVTAKWLRAWLVDPATWTRFPRMPRFRLDDEEVDFLVAYLMSLKGQEIPSPGVDFEEEADDVEGKRVFGEARCVTCHSVGVNAAGRRMGGDVGPDLSQIGSKVKGDWLYYYLQDPLRYSPETTMPRYGFDEETLVNLVGYMVLEFLGEEEEEEGAPADVERDPALIAAGKEVFRKKGCQGCHLVAPDDERTRVGPTLETIASRPLQKLDFGGARDVRRDLPNWLLSKIVNPAVFDPKAKMPAYRFSDADAGAVTLTLLAMVKREPPPAKIVKGDGGGGERWWIQGPFGRLVRIYRCLSCHRIKGDGSDLSHAPLDAEGGRVREDWLRRFMEEPYTIRVHTTERMPRLFLEPEEVEALADGIRFLLVDDRIPGGEGSASGQGDAEKGRAVFRKRGCGGCHTLAGLGKGYVGPRLDEVGDRLTSGWLRVFLGDPWAFLPGIPMPKPGLSGEELRDLTALLREQKRTEEGK